MDLIWLVPPQANESHVRSEKMGHEFLNGCIHLLSGKEVLITSLGARLKTDFEQRLFEATINNLFDAYNPLRFNNFAYATRELVRHILTRIAPDKGVLGL